MAAIPRSASSTNAYTDVKEVFICDECASEKGKAPKTSYTLTVIGSAMGTLGVILARLGGSAVTVAGICIGLGWFLSLICAMVVTMSGQGVHSTGKCLGYTFSTFIPPLALILFLVNRKKLFTAVQSRRMMSLGSSCSKSSVMSMDRLLQAELDTRIRP